MHIINVKVVTHCKNVTFVMQVKNLQASWRSAFVYFAETDISPHARFSPFYPWPVFIFYFWHVWLWNVHMFRFQTLQDWVCTGYAHRSFTSAEGLTQKPLVNVAVQQHSTTENTVCKMCKPRSSRGECNHLNQERGKYRCAGTTHIAYTHSAILKDFLRDVRSRFSGSK